MLQDDELELVLSLLAALAMRLGQRWQELHAEDRQRVIAALEGVAETLNNDTPPRRLDA